MSVTSATSSTMPLIAPVGASAAEPVAGPATITDAGAQAARAAGSDDQSDRFLKLLVAQMRNQDPLNPLDNAQVTTQMAQISTVQGVEKLNTSMQRWLEQSGAVQRLEGAGLVGRNVLIDGDQVALTGGVDRTSMVRAGYELSEPAGKVRIELLNTSDQVVSALEQASMPAGTHTFEWDGRDGNGKALADGTYRLRVTAGSAADMKPATTFQSAQVTALLSSSSGSRLELGAAGQRPVADVRAVL